MIINKLLHYFLFLCTPSFLKHIFLSNLSLFLRDYRSLNLSMLLLMVFRIETPTTRASQEHLASLPCKDVAKSYYNSD